MITVTTHQIANVTIYMLCKFGSIILELPARSIDYDKQAKFVARIHESRVFEDNEHYELLSFRHHAVSWHHANGYCWELHYLPLQNPDGGWHLSAGFHKACHSTKKPSLPLNSTLRIPIRRQYPSTTFPSQSLIRTFRLYKTGFSGLHNNGFSTNILLCETTALPACTCILFVIETACLPSGRNSSYSTIPVKSLRPSFRTCAFSNTSAEASDTLS